MDDRGIDPAISKSEQLTDDIVLGSKPKLPVVPELVLDRAYKASGKCPPSGLVRMIGIGLIAGALVGVLGYYIGLLIPILYGWLVILLAWVGSILGGIGSMVGGRTAIVSTGIQILIYILFFIIGLGIGLGYPALLGGILGTVTGVQASNGKCRSPGKVFLISFFIAVFSYVIFTIIAIQSTGTIQFTSRIWILPLEQGIDNPWWIYLLVGIDALILALIAGVVSSGTVTEPFCEHCEKWYDSSQLESFSTSLAQPLIDTLKAGSLQGLENSIRLSPTEFPRLALGITRCSTCEVSDFQLRARVFWQEKWNTEKQSFDNQKEAVWFSTMVPAKMGTELLTLLFSKKSVPIKPIEPLTEHELAQREASQLLTCPHCNLPFKSESSLEQHISNWHQ